MTELSVSHIEIAKLELQPGDILVIRVPPDWDYEMQKIAHKAVSRAMEQAGIKVPAIIGSTDVELQVIRKDAA